MAPSAAAPHGGTWPEGYRRAVDFYLRDDVSEALTTLSQRRRPHFLREVFGLDAAKLAHAGRVLLGPTS